MKTDKKIEVAKIYQKKACNVSATCTAAGISRFTFYEWKKNDEEFAKMIEECDEAIIDFTESKLIEAINERNLTAIIFYLKTKGKKRGYVETTELESRVRVESQVTPSQAKEILKKIEEEF